MLKQVQLAPSDGGKVTLALDKGDLAMITGPEALAQEIERAIVAIKAADGSSAERAMKEATARIAQHLVEISAFRSDDLNVEFDFLAVGYPKARKRVALSGPIGSSPLAYI